MWGWALSCKNTSEDKEESSDRLYSVGSVRFQNVCIGLAQHWLSGGHQGTQEEDRQAGKGPEELGENVRLKSRGCGSQHPGSRSGLCRFL